MELECEWGDNCFRCRRSYCRKYGKSSLNDLKQPGTDVIIATFPDRSIKRYSESQLPELIKKLNSTESEVLKCANTDGWHGDTLLMWAKRKRGTAFECQHSGVRAVWPDGRITPFTSAVEAAKYFNTSPRHINNKAEARSFYGGALILRFGTNPHDEEVELLRCIMSRHTASKSKKVQPKKIPAPTARELELINAVNDIRRKYIAEKQCGFYHSGIACTWETGESFVADTTSLVADVVGVMPDTVNVHVRRRTPYKGVMFEKL